MKWISYFFVIIFSHAILAQALTPFEKYVFQDTNLDYDPVKKEFLRPKTGDAYRSCRYQELPPTYICSGAGGGPSYNYITEGDKPGDFQTAIMRPEKAKRAERIAVSSTVKDAKVTEQSHCYYSSQYKYSSNSEKSYYLIAGIECYTVTTKICSILNKIKTREDFKNEALYKDFVRVLKSEEYKKSLLEAQKYNYKHAFLSINRESNYSHYSQHKNSTYDVKRQGKVKATSLVNFEDSLAVQNSKNLYEVATKASYLFRNAYFAPCQNMSYNNILAGSEVKYVDEVNNAKNDTNAK